jgi:hypothetical protein
VAVKSLDGDSLSAPDPLFAYGNDVISNLDPLGAGSVRVNVQIGAHPGAGITETSAVYIRNNHGTTWDTEERFAYAIYGEQDQYQHLAGGSWSKVIHRGWGDAHFVACMATGDLVPIADVSNTSPIVVTTSRKHGFGHNNIHQVTGVLGNTAANAEAWYACKVLDEYRLELGVDAAGDPSAGNGAYTGGGQITCINSQVGYEAAVFSENFLLQYYPTAAERAPLIDTIGRANGAVGYLASIQGGFMPGGGIMPGDLVPGTDVWESGLGRCKLFEALVENDELFSGGCYIAADTPNRAFVAHKRQYFRDTAGPPAGNGIGAFAMFVLEEAYYNPQNNDGSATAAMTRWELDNDAVVKAYALLSSAGTPTRDAPSTYQYGSYWNGSASVRYGLRHHVDVTATTPAANYDLLFGPAGAELVKFRFKSDGTLQMLTGDLDLQSHSIIGVAGLTFAGAASLDLGGGDIVGVDDFTFAAGGGGLLDLQGGDITGVDDLTAAGAGSVWDLQGGGLAMGGGDITGVDDLTFAGATSVIDLQSGTIVACGGITFSTGLLDMQDRTIAFGTVTGGKIGQSNAAKFAFWDSTPVAQQVLATGAGATADNIISLLQTLGLCRQA